MREGSKWALGCTKCLSHYKGHSLPLAATSSRLQDNFFKLRNIVIRALRGRVVGLSFIEFCGTEHIFEKFNAVKVCARWEWDQIIALRDGSKGKIY